MKSRVMSVIAHQKYQSLISRADSKQYHRALRSNLDPHPVNGVSHNKQCINNPL